MEGVARGERARDNILTALHICHLSRVPFGHVLIEHRCTKKHCKRGCNKKEREKHSPHHTTTKEPFQKKTKIYSCTTERVRIVIR